MLLMSKCSTVQECRIPPDLFLLEQRRSESHLSVPPSLQYCFAGIAKDVFIHTKPIQSPLPISNLF